MEEKKLDSTSKEYQKKYYEENKQKINAQSRNAQKILRVDKIIMSLNANKYKRFPYSKIKKYNIKYNESTKLYSL